jgi:hypothetical protein
MRIDIDFEWGKERKIMCWCADLLVCWCAGDNLFENVKI